MPQQEVISVIIPVYNVEMYLTRCLHSVICQTYNNIEIILVNDGSTDDSLKICQEFAALDDRVVLINKTNGGLSSARNAGLAQATGAYISFVDSDDYISPIMLEVLLNNIKSEKADISECGVYHTSSNIAELSSITITTVDKESWLLNVIEKSQYAVWRRLYKKEILENKEFKVGYIYEDVFFLYNVLDRINKIVKTSEKLYFYYDENISIMRSDFSEKNLDIIPAFRYQHDMVKACNFNNQIILLTRTFYESELLNKFCMLSYFPQFDRRYKMRKLIIKELAIFRTKGVLATIIVTLPIFISSSVIKFRHKFNSRDFKL